MAKHKVASGDSRAELARMRSDLARKIAAHIQLDGREATGIPGLSLYRKSAPTECTSAAYEPELIVFAQGEKRINVGGTTLVCDYSTFLLTSIDMPVISQVTKATREEPILALLLRLDMPSVREILSQEEFHLPEAASGARGMAVGKTSPELFDACFRLLNLLDAPKDIPFLSTLIQREVIYRERRRILERFPVQETIHNVGPVGNALTNCWVRCAIGNVDSSGGHPASTGATQSDTCGCIVASDEVVVQQRERVWRRRRGLAR